MVLIDTSDKTSRPQQPIFVALRLWLQTVLTSSVMQSNHMVQWPNILASYCNLGSHWQRHIYMRMQVYLHVHQSSNCQYYQYSTCIHYHINTTSQQFLCTSNCHKTVTSHCGEIQTHCSRKTSLMLWQLSSLHRRPLTIKAFQPGPTHRSEIRTHCSEYSLSIQSKTSLSKHNSLLSIWACSLQREPYSL